MAGGVSQWEVAQKFNVHSSTVSQIVRNLLYLEPDYIPSRKASNQKLTKAQADEIRERIKFGATPEALAEEYGVTSDNIRAIITGKTHHGIPRQYSKRPQEAGKSRPTLQSINGPAPTSKAEQQRRQEELLIPERKPRRKPGEPPITDRDWTLNVATGCHEWVWAKNNLGYGVAQYKGMRSAHRIAWIMYNGPIPKGHQINHRCNNASCINPEHLCLGDQFENMQDTVRAGNHATQKLTWEDALKIRAMYEPGKIAWQAIADEFGVTKAAIGSIINNKTFPDTNYAPQKPGISVLRKLATETVNIIREKYEDSRVTLSALAREFSVSRSVIGEIIRNESYHDPNYKPPSDRDNSPVEIVCR